MNQTPPINVNLFDWIRLSDSALPIGSFAHSFGLETSIQDGRIKNGEDLTNYLDAELKLRIVTSDIPLLRQIHKAATQENLIKIEDLNQTVECLKHAKEYRSASLQMGNSLLNLSLQTIPSPLLKKVKNLFAPKGCHHITTLACVMASRDLDSKFACSTYLYGYLSSRISVAVRLIPMGQTEGQNILISFFPQCQDLLEKSLNQEEISDFSGICDIQMMRHEKLESRTFRS